MCMMSLPIIKLIRSYNVVLSTFDGAPVYYNVDGSEPDDKSSLYEDTLSLKSSALLKLSLCVRLARAVC